uniref:NnrS family protein n=1 Tax=Thauera sp. SDU_THAU2 TaxID=3136633 RepID=UPI00311F494D
MALGYGLIGLSLLGVAVASSAGLHLLTVGAMGLSIFGVLCIAGRTHSGYELDMRPWVPVAALAIGAAALARAAAGLPGMPVAGLQAASVAAWALGYGLAAVFLGAVFLRPRPDAGTGCEEPMEESA